MLPRKPLSEPGCSDECIPSPIRQLAHSSDLWFFFQLDGSAQVEPAYLLFEWSCVWCTGDRIFRQLTSIDVHRQKAPIKRPMIRLSLKLADNRDEAQRQNEATSFWRIRRTDWNQTLSGACKKRRRRKSKKWDSCSWISFWGCFYAYVFVHGYGRCFGVFERQFFGSRSIWTTVLWMAKYLNDSSLDEEYLNDILWMTQYFNDSSLAYGAFATVLWNTEFLNDNSLDHGVCEHHLWNKWSFLLLFFRRRTCMVWFIQVVSEWVVLFVSLLNV